MELITCNFDGWVFPRIWLRKPVDLILEVNGLIWSRNSVGDLEFPKLGKPLRRVMAV